jgi:hypothetical protein
MWRILLRWLTPLLLGGLSMSPLCAQAPQPSPDKDKKSPFQELRWREEEAVRPASKESSGGRVPVLEYALAIGGTLLVLLIVCMPSRKSQ